MIEHFGHALMALGTVFLLLGALGMIRFGDAYLRMQVSTKSLTFGLGFFLPGAALLTGDPSTIMKALLAVLFQFLTAPIAAHILARSALRRHLPVTKLADDPPKSLNDGA